MRIGHPALLESLMPVELLAVVQRHHRVGEGCLARERTATLRKWLSWAQELGDQEEALKANLPSFRKEVLSSAGMCTS